jgi:hypothetical protein
MQTDRKINYGLLKADLFLACLMTLILNDFIFKYKFPGLITGKLSDFAGLFIFPYFFSTFFFGRKKTIYWLTAILFTLWKLPIFDGVVNTFNSLDLVFIKRIKDVSDLIALTAVPVSFLYFKSESTKIKTISKLQVYFFTFFSLFAFTATTIGQKEYKKEITLNKTYKLPINKEIFLKEYTSQAHGFPLSENDTSFYIYCRAVDNWRVRLTFEGSMVKLADKSTRLNIYKLTEYKIENKGLFRGPNEDVEENIQSLPDWGFLKILNENLLRTLKSKSLRHNERIWYDIKPSLDSMYVNRRNHNKH